MDVSFHFCVDVSTGQNLIEDEIMTRTALIVGVAGRFGRQCALALQDAGWTVRGLARSAEKAACIPGVVPIVGDVMDAVVLQKAATGVDVIVQAANPPYQLWKDQLLALNRGVIDAALAVDAAVVVPQNVYVFPQVGGAWSETTPRTASHELAVLRTTMENAYRTAAQDRGLNVIALRMGDFIDGPTHRPSGNWFENHITKAVTDRVFTYPGPMDQNHAWAYLPDAARAVAQLLEQNAHLQGHIDINFPGWTLTGAHMQAAIESAIGHALKTKKMPWPIMKIIALWSPPLRNVVSLRYLWDVPHHLTSERFNSILTAFKHSDPRDVFIGRW